MSDGKGSAMSVPAQGTLTQPVERTVKFNLAAGVGGNRHPAGKCRCRVMSMEKFRQHKTGKIRCEEECAGYFHLRSDHGLI